MKGLLGFLLCGTFFLLSHTLNAFPYYVTSIPNGGINACANCHINPGGGGPRNDFGLDFAGNGFLWDTTLALIDSDLDGYTNGDELQDPDGTWAVGAPDPGEPCLVSNPGDLLDTPTPVATLTLNYDGSPVQAGTYVDFSADLTVDDCYTSPQTFDVWIDVTLPNGQSYGGNPVFGPMNLTLPPGFAISGYPLSLYVPPPAPTGTYTITGNAGIYPNEVYDSSVFTVDVVP